MIRVLVLCLAFVGAFSLRSGVGLEPLTWAAIDNVDYEVPVCEDDGDGIHLDLSNVGLSTINERMVSNSRITCLNLSGNSIRTVAPNVFGVLSELRYLNLAGSPMLFHKISQNQFPKLRTLVLDGQHGSPPNYDFDSAYPESSLPELQKLSLQNYQYKGRNAIHSWLSMLNIPNLTHLYLAKNNLVPRDLEDILAKMNNLTHLYLDGNALSHSDGLSLQLLQNLEHLSLASNGMRTIPMGAAEYLTNLRSLNLAGNRISRFPSNTLTRLVNLRNLALDGNSLMGVPDICGLVELRSLSLSGNRIRFLNKKSFCNLPRLSSVNLKHNSLTSIADGTFGHLPALVELDLSNNLIASLSENWMAPRNFLTELLLDGNSFETIESMSFIDMSGR